MKCIECKGELIEFCETCTRYFLPSRDESHVSHSIKENFCDICYTCAVMKKEGGIEHVVKALQAIDKVRLGR